MKPTLMFFEGGPLHHRVARVPQLDPEVFITMASPTQAAEDGHQLHHVPWRHRYVLQVRTTRDGSQWKHYRHAPECKNTGKTE